MTATIPQYSTDMNAAVKVLEHLNTACEVRYDPQRRLAWVVGIGVYDPPVGLGEAATLPHAICLAALDYVEKRSK